MSLILVTFRRRGGRKPCHVWCFSELWPLWLTQTTRLPRERLRETQQLFPFLPHHHTTHMLPAASICIGKESLAIFRPTHGADGTSSCVLLKVVISLFRTSARQEPLLFNCGPQILCTSSLLNLRNWRYRKILLPCRASAPHLYVAAYKSQIERRI